MYYKAKKKALANNQEFHVAAVLMRKKHTVRIGTNQNKTHPKYRRKYADGSFRSHLHAEMDVLRFAEPGDIIYVLRFDKRGNLTMAKPCKFCQKHIRLHGIKTVHYSDWDGNMIEWKL